MLSKNALAFGGTFLVLGAAILIASLGGEPQHEPSFSFDSPRNRLVPTEQLASWIIEGRRDFSIVDMRDSGIYAKGHIRDAVNCGSCHENKEEGAAAQHGEGFVDLSKRLVIYTDTGAEPVNLPKILRDNSRLYRLDGGWQAWRAEILAPVSFEDITDEQEMFAARKREAVRGFFAGEGSTVKRVAKLPVAPIRRRNQHKIATVDEGC